MKKNINKVETIDMEEIEMKKEILEENETMEIGKTKWSLKKKLLIGCGILTGLVFGAIALGSKKGEKTTTDCGEELDNDTEETIENIVVSEESTENVTE